MKKFTKIQEDNSNRKFFEVSATIKLYIEADNEGESGYRADSILGSIKEHTDYTIENISEISKEEYISIFENKSSTNKNI